MGGTELFADVGKGVVEDLVRAHRAGEFTGGALEEHAVLQLTGECGLGFVALCREHFLVSV